MEAPLLEFCHTDICYRGRRVVEKVSLTVAPGEILGIVGESGSGKSTLIKAAMGLLDKEDRVSSGDILYRGSSVINIKGEALRQLRGPEMGMIFQNCGAALCPIRTIEAQLYEAVREHETVSREEIRRRALELFERMKLQDGERILKSYPFELSGGMNQRVGIMMAMVLKPRLLFADEPTSALDVTVQAQVLKELQALRTLYGTTIVLVTHNIGIVDYMADRAAVLKEGRLIECGPAREIIRNPQEEYTKTLIGAVLRIHRG